MRRYLVVDDNRDLAENLAEILSDEVAEASVALSGPQALELVGRTRFDALVTDMRMPDMGGAELVHAVRRLDPGLPALVITGYSEDRSLAAARHEGLLAVLEKPIPLERLQALLGVARRDGLVAVVEDNPSQADNLAEVLASRGFAAVTAASVTETDRLGPVVPCCAVVDLRIPGGPDGEAMRRLAERFPGLPLLVVTAHEVEPPLPHRGLFRKPFDVAALLEAVEAMHAGRAAAPP
ncbi:MAG TPA: response regulator [Anaeromyxobacteraceae bacterium]|nr:response regulator [Anaeromyxobacteraceae bacterium]